jgi:hemerythrin-like domain-containing protein
MSCVDVLLDEHRAIEKMLNVLEAAAGRLERGESLPHGAIAGLLEFFRVFADGVHHQKEEAFLFPALVAHDRDAATPPVEAYLVQHDIGRGYMREMHEAAAGMERGIPASAAAFAASARDYIAMLREHIRIEDHYFVDFAAQLLSSDEDARVSARMAGADDETGGRERQRCLDMVSRYTEMAATW